MNSKHILTAVGLGTLTIGLVALPGSSARKPAATAGPELYQQEESQDPEQQVTQLRRALKSLELAQNVTVDDDNDLQVFVNSGWLGARTSEVTADKVKELKLPAERGVVLGKIVPDSPAAKAGLKESDVVTEVNGQRVEGTEQFRRMIREIPAGRSVQFTVWRDGRAQSIEVTLGRAEMRHNTRTFLAPATPGNFAFEMPDMPEVGTIFEDGPWASSSKTRLGIDAENLDGEFGNYFGAPEGEGILVRGVFPDTPAAKAGVKVGDVITSVNGERVRSVGELRSKIAEKRQEKTLKLGLIRNKATTSVSVELPPPAEKKEFRTGVRTNI
jgi:serine protease Do